MDWSTLMMIAVMGGAVYFLMIRPQQKKAKEQTNLMNSMEPGSRVMTISGIVGTIKYLGEKQIILEISPGVEMTMDKRAISTQAVSDEFEYAEDAEPKLIEDDSYPSAAELTATGAVETTAPAETIEPARTTETSELDEALTDRPTWEAPGTSKN